jgi:hypothetical protein
MKMLCDTCFENRSNFHDGCTMPYCNCCGWALNLGKETMNQATPEDYLREEAVKDGLDAFDKWKIETKFQPSTGCWVDGHWGHYGVSRLVDIAQDYGMEISELDSLALHAYTDGIDEFEDEQTGEYHSAADWMLMQGGLGDEAEEWLDINVAEEEYMFGWYSGEFFYMHKSWWEETP